MPSFLNPLRDLTGNIRRLLALGWQDHKLLLLVLAGLSVAGSGVAFLRSAAWRC